MTEWNIHPSAQQEHDELLEYFGGIDEELVIAFELQYLQSPLLHGAGLAEIVQSEGQAMRHVAARLGSGGWRAEIEAGQQQGAQ